MTSANRSCIRSLTTLVMGPLFLVGTLVLPINAQSTNPATMAPQWIWSPDHVPGDAPLEACYFRKSIHLSSPKRGVIRIAGDDEYELYVNSKLVHKGSSSEMSEHDISPMLKHGNNVIAAKVTNRNGQTAGLAAEIAIEDNEGDARLYLTNPTWRTSLKVLPLWQSKAYRDSRWKAARNLGAFGQYQPGEPTGVNQVVTKVQPGSEPITRRDERPSSRPSPPLIAKESTEQLGPTDTTNSSTPSDPTSMGDPTGPTFDRVVSRRDPSDHAPRRDIQYPEFSVQAGFQIQHVAGNDETGSILSMAFNEFGQILVSQEGGPLLLIYDSNDNGSPDKVRICCQHVKNCQGILPVSGKVYVVGTGSEGYALYELEDSDHDGMYEKASAILSFRGSQGEHGPHGLTLGPDGMLYVAFGNHTQVARPFAQTSPYLHRYEGDLVKPRYEDPQGKSSPVPAPGGGVFRVDLEGKRVELFAGGQRNVYDLAFNGAGDLFMHDSDMESDMGTSWHRPTRLMYVAAGGEYGWRSGWAKWPDYLIDTLPAIRDTGRGSPTGCVFYQHTSFPAKYRNALFSCDWSQGEINVFRLDQRGAGYAANPELFLRGKPLNVTDIDVGPDGWLYFCTGGRGTQGNIFRITYPNAKRPTFPKEGLMAALRQPGLNTAWGRQAVSAIREKMGGRWDHDIREFVGSTKNSPIDRANALQIMHLVGPPPSDVELIDISFDKDARLRAKSAYLMGLVANDLTAKRLVEMLRDDQSLVRRHACQALARANRAVSLQDLQPLLVSPDRFESFAARRLLEQNDSNWQSAVLASDSHRVFVQGAAAMMIATPTRELGLQVIQRFEELRDGFISDLDFVDMLRVVQLAIERGKLKPVDVDSFAKGLATEFPAGNTQINRELTRLLVYIQASDAIDSLLDYLDSDVDNIEKVHVAMHLRFMKAGWTPEQRLRHLRFLERAAESDRQRSLAGYLNAAAMDIAREMSAEHRALVLDHGDELPQMAIATLYSLPEEKDRENFERLRRLDFHIADLEGEHYDRLRIGLVAVIARSRDDLHMAYLREAYDRSPERRQAIAMGLAQKPDGRNWDYLVRSIPLLEGDAAREVLSKLREAPFAPEESEHIRQVILCGLRLRDEGAREACELLSHWVRGRPDFEGDDWESQLEAWQDWFSTKHPHQPVAELPMESGRNTWTYHDLEAYLSSNEGRSGSIVRGAKVYEKAQCAACHQHGTIGNNYGPDLTTVSHRFQVREILESIIYPSQVISDQYRSHTIITTRGRQISGLLVPVDNDSVRLVTTNGDTRLLRESDIDEVLPNSTSSMPEGLLNSLSLQEIADLFAFLEQRQPDVARQDEPNLR